MDPPEVGVPDARNPSTVTTDPDPVPSEPVNPGSVPMTSDPMASDALTSDPVMSAPVTSDPVNPDPKTSDPDKRLIAKRTDAKKMSKKEKKFHLSKDDGKYAELNPINPHEAKLEYGDTLRLNPVGPAFGGVASLEEGQVVTSHNTSSVPGPEDSELGGGVLIHCPDVLTPQPVLLCSCPDPLSCPAVSMS